MRNTSESVEPVKPESARINAGVTPQSLIPWIPRDIPHSRARCVSHARRSPPTQHFPSFPNCTPSRYITLTRQQQIGSTRARRRRRLRRRRRRRRTVTNVGSNTTNSDETRSIRLNRSRNKSQLNLCTHFSALAATFSPHFGERYTRFRDRVAKLIAFIKVLPSSRY